MNAKIDLSSTGESNWWVRIVPALNHTLTLIHAPFILVSGIKSRSISVLSIISEILKSLHSVWLVVILSKINPYINRDKESVRYMGQVFFQFVPYRGKMNYCSLLTIFH